MDTKKWMGIALLRAKDSLKAGEVPVGCLFVYKNDIVATGYNTVNKTRNATRHAEINCIDQVLKFCAENSLNFKEVFREISVIVTVEPCIMCTSALYQLQVQRIVYGCANDRFGGCMSVLRVPPLYNAEVIVIAGVENDRAMSLLKEFYKGTNPNAPESKVKKSRKDKVEAAV